MKNIISTVLLFLFLLPASSLFATTDSSSDNPNIKELAKYFEAKGYEFNKLLEDSRFKLVEKITEKFTRSAEVRIESFEQYQNAVGYESKKNKIREFMNLYSVELAAAEKEYGIPKNIIAGIIGIESEFGQYVGSYNPFNAYVSMYSEGHRSEFAKAQLEELLIFAKNNELDVFEMKSSYAGAMSFAQFIPYSLNRWFVGKDLYHMPNNIKSVANYLAHFLEITGSLEKAIYRYNPSSMYTKVVLALAEEGEG
jgi:membrane-bound lytic murein transglycosylase B